MKTQNGEYYNWPTEDSHRHVGRCGVMHRTRASQLSGVWTSSAHESICCFGISVIMFTMLIGNVSTCKEKLWAKTLHNSQEVRVISLWDETFTPGLKLAFSKLLTARVNEVTNHKKCSTIYTTKMFWFNYLFLNGPLTSCCSHFDIVRPRRQRTKRLLSGRLLPAATCSGIRCKWPFLLRPRPSLPPTQTTLLCSLLCKLPR